jgi:hypothetical protein
MVSRQALLGMTMLLHCGGAAFASLPSGAGACVHGGGFGPPSRVVARLLEAVDNGKLAVLDIPVTRDMITARQVEYLYDLGDPTPTVKVRADLKEPVAFPAYGSEVRFILITVDPDGGIVDTHVHLWPVQSP